jgi:hypothetical protein
MSSEDSPSDIILMISSFYKKHAGYLQTFYYNPMRTAIESLSALNNNFLALLVLGGIESNSI